MVEEIGVKELKEKCADYLEISVSEVEAYAATLDKHFPDEQYKVLPNHVIQLSCPKRPIEEYSRLAASQDILIIGLERHQHSLEDYYMNLKGDVNHA